MSALRLGIPASERVIQTFLDSGIRPHIMKSLVAFAHGKESGPWGSKISYLAEIASNSGVDVISPDYSNIANPDHRIAHLLNLPEIKKSDSLILVGSSMGGYVSVVASQALNPKGLFLLAPAIGIVGYSLQQPTVCSEHTEIVMGWNDEVIPVPNVVNFASVHKARLHLLNSDHRLNTVLTDIGNIFKDFLHRVLQNQSL